MAEHSDDYMRRALKLARRGRGWVEPNPMVGAVLVRDGRIIGEGWHQRYGGPHAEIEALRDAAQRGENPAGADLYVTLEPCCHHGKTPPCTDAVIQAKVARVFIAMIDPNPKVHGQGMARLREAGIAVHSGLCESEARRLNAPFIKRIDTGLPWVIAKWAQTLDGRVATGTGNSQWISNEQSRRLVHRLRGRVDAVMVGIGTVRADNPRLTARDVPIRRLARPVVIDPNLTLSPDVAFVRNENVSLTLAVREAILEAMPPRVKELAERGVEFVGLPDDPLEPSRVLLRPVLEHLAERRQATNVLVEGGPVLMGALLREGLIDQVLAFIAPKLLGDTTARAAVEGLMRSTIAEATPLHLTSVRRLGDDVLLNYRFSPVVR